jgi:Helix-turn-helix domain
MNHSPVIIVTDKETLQQVIEEALARYAPSSQVVEHLWLNPKEAAELLGNHHPTEIIQLCNQGKLEHFRKGKTMKSRYFISRTSLLTYSPTKRPIKRREEKGK